MNKLNYLQLEFAIEITRECFHLYELAGGDFLDSRDVNTVIQKESIKLAKKYLFYDFSVKCDFLDIVFVKGAEIRRQLYYKAAL